MSTGLQRRPGIDPAVLLGVRASSPHTQAAYRRAVSLFVSWAGQRTLSARLFSEWIEEMRQDGTGASALRQRLYGGKAAIMQAATEAGMGPREWQALKTALDSIPTVKTPEPSIRVLTGAERSRVLAVMGPRMRLLARFLYATGARISEALAVKEVDITTELSTARIRIHGKGRKERTARIPMELLREINEAYKKAGRLWLFEDKPGRPYCRQSVTRAIREAGLAELGRMVSAHDFRHSRATDLFARTKNLKGVSQFLGHSGIGTTAMYYVKTELTPDELWEGETI